DAADAAAELEHKLRVLAAVHLGQPQPAPPSRVAAAPDAITDKPHESEFMLEIDRLFAEHVKTAQGLPLPSGEVANLSRAVKLALLLFTPCLHEDRKC